MFRFLYRVSEHSVMVIGFCFSLILAVGSFFVARGLASFKLDLTKTVSGWNGFLWVAIFLFYLSGILVQSLKKFSRLARAERLRNDKRDRPTTKSGVALKD